MLVKKSDITKIDMIEYSNNDFGENDFCVRFHLERGCIILPCFYSAGFPLDDDPEGKEKQLRLTKTYLDKHPDDAYVELNATLLYDMNVYH